MTHPWRSTMGKVQHRREQKICLGLISPSSCKFVVLFFPLLYSQKIDLKSNKFKEFTYFAKLFLFNLSLLKFLLKSASKQRLIGHITCRNPRNSSCFTQITQCLLLIFISRSFMFSITHLIIG